MKRLIRFFMFLLLVAGGVYVYARYVEPNMLKVETVLIESDKIAQDVTVAVFSDTHLQEGFDSGKLDRICQKINEQNPDVILFLGDLYDDYSLFPDNPEQITAKLNQLKAPVKLAVYGNHDYGGKAKNIYQEIMTGAGFTIHKGKDTLETAYNISFTGLDDFIFGTPNVGITLNQDAYNFIFAHAPDSVLNVESYDFYVAGHSHGGQVKVPFLRPFILPRGTETGWGGLEKNTDGTVKYITRGIGTSILPYRFGAVPEITICKFSNKTVEKKNKIS